MEQNGNTLSMHNDSVYKGGAKHNGTLLKLHENAYTIGYSGLLKADGTEGANIKFGDGVFLDISQKNNIGYAGAPTVLGAVPAFGGIMVREPAIASGYPVNNDEVAPYQKGMLCKEGYVIYKFGNVCTGNNAIISNVPLFGKVFVNQVLWVNKSNGKAYFSAKSTVYNASGDLMVGRVVEVNPDDESVTVYVSPMGLADTADIAGATPTLTLGTTEAHAIPVSVSIGVPSDVVISYKKHAESDYVVFETLTPALNAGGTAYEATTEITGLDGGTSYDVKAEAFSACGLKSDTETKSTQST